MSAYMVSKNHIDAIVLLAFHGPKGTNQQLWFTPYFNGKQLYEVGHATLGQALVCENLASIHARYPDTIDEPDNMPGPIDHYWDIPYVAPYLHTPRVSAVEGLKLLDCYQYQSCEHDGWQQSAVKAFCEQLYSRLVSELPGYEEAPWSLD